MAGDGVVGVFPVEQHGSRERLFRTLEGVFGVTFVARRQGECRGLDAAVVLDDTGAIGDDLLAAGVPTLTAPAHAGSRHQDSGDSVEFASAPEVDARLRGRRLTEAHAAVVPLDAVEGATVLAWGGAGAVWARAGRDGVAHHRVSTSLDELRPGARLKDDLAACRFLSLLPLVQFLRDVFEGEWQRPTLRASFILDDPNLHWRSYGYLHYPELATHARAHGYHAGIAMVPIDATFAHPATVQLFRSSPQLSLMVHGNDHVKRELAQPLPREAAVALLAQAMRRMSSFERRYNLPVNRVMVPPHYDCIEPTMAAMVDTGFEAVCYTGPVDVTDDPLVGWAPADVHLGEGLPGLHRLPFDAPTDELVLRAFLDQPILLYGHHTDLAKGMDVLAETADRVNALGEVTWLPSSDVARSSYLLRHDGTTLHAMAYSRRMVVVPPDEATRLLVHLPPTAGKREETVRVVGRGDEGVMTGDAIEVTSGAPITVELRRPAGASAGAAPARPAWRPWPIVRRCLTETRDRVSPLLGVEWSQRQVQ